ncbi:hypothetical protein B0O80DRAFT_385066 [Mortierella sp. GBAus27b]|nr:chitin deacetylase [Mortierella sp. GBA43]KAI8355989.1 hypothetical protein B0O80DRAFT_385066 [Mortierella sp. GBAus27b]
MKTNAIITLSALFLATAVTAQGPTPDPRRIEKCTKPGLVAWTFDDGPDQYNTELLNILDESQVKVTFYMLGSMIAKNAANQASLKEILKRGHQLASHSYSHTNFENGGNPSKPAPLSNVALRKEMTDTSDLLWQHAGVRVAYMRPPEGACEKTCLDTMDSMKYVVSHWNVDTNDWRHKSEAVPSAVTNSLKEPLDLIVAKGNPATDSFILLQHEIHAFSVRNLTRPLMKAIKDKGYKFVTMEECVGKPAYHEVRPDVVLPTGGSSTTPAVPSPTPPTTGTVAPTGTTPQPPAVSVNKPNTPNGQTGDSTKGNSAGIVKVAGAWAMGLAAAVSYAFL